MPDGTSKLKWDTGRILLRSDLTELLNDLFGEDIATLHSLQYEALKKHNALLSSSNDWKDTIRPFLEEKLKDYVSDPGLPNLSQAQLIARVIQHIESWPNDPPSGNGKEQLRQKLVAETEAAVKRSFKFKWRLNEDPHFEKEDITIKETPQTITVFFVNPGKRVYYEQGAPDDVRIQIGPE